MKSILCFPCILIFAIINNLEVLHIIISLYSKEPAVYSNNFTHIAYKWPGKNSNNGNTAINETKCGLVFNSYLREQKERSNSLAHVSESYFLTNLLHNIRQILLLTPRSKNQYFPKQNPCLQTIMHILH